MKKFRPKKHLPNILVAYPSYEVRPTQEPTPQEQLQGLKHHVTVVDYFDQIPIVLLKGHRTTIMLADMNLAHNPKDPLKRISQHQNLCVAARKAGLQGLGILIDAHSKTGPYVNNHDGITVVVSKIWYSFGIRNWIDLFAEVKTEIRKRQKMESAARKRPPENAKMKAKKRSHS